MYDPAQLTALATALRAGSFDAAAAELSVTPSAISQRIKALEDRVGTVLILRTQPCAATPAGARLARHAEDVQLLEAMVVADLGQASSVPVPTVRVAVNADSLATWVLPALAATRDLLFDLVIDDQDHSADWLRRGEVSCAVTTRASPIQGCDSHPLGTLRYLATASPAYVRRWLPHGPTAEALALAPTLTYDAKDRLQSLWLRRMFGRRVGYRGHMLASSQGFVEAALLGLGWGMNPETLVRAHIDEGRLVALDDAPLDVHLHWQISRIAAPALAPLTRAVLAEARRELSG